LDPPARFPDRRLVGKKEGKKKKTEVLAIRGFMPMREGGKERKDVLGDSIVKFVNSRKGRGKKPPKSGNRDLLLQVTPSNGKKKKSPAPPLPAHHICDEREGKPVRSTLLGAKPEGKKKKKGQRRPSCYQKKEH